MSASREVMNAALRSSDILSRTSARPRSPRSRAARQVLDHVAHQRRSRLDVRLGPLGARRVRPPILRDGHEPIRHEVAILVVHELEVAGVPGRDHGLPVRHRLGQREAEPLAPVQRDVAVAGGDRRLLVVGRHVLVHDADVRATLGRGDELARADAASARAPFMPFSTSTGPSPGSKASLNASTTADRVLAPRADEVEDEEEHEPVGQPELGACRSRRRRRFDRQRHEVHGHVRRGRDGAPHVLARHPHLVDESRARRGPARGRRSSPRTTRRSCGARRRSSTPASSRNVCR